MNSNLILRNGNTVFIVFTNGMSITSYCDDETFEYLKNMTEASPQEIMDVLSTNDAKLQEAIKHKNLFNRVKKSQLLTQRNDSVYWKAVSELSMPEDFVNTILDAEEEGDENKLEAYKNFWTLLSLNPDSRCRANLWWYLNKWGFKVSKHGFFIGYRNVDVYNESDVTWFPQSLCDYVKENYEKIKAQKKSPKHYWVEVLHNDDYYLINENTRTFDELDNDDNLRNLAELYEEFKAVNFIAKNCGNDTIYTDGHSHTFRIKVGELVTMPREKCDSDQDHQCSTGYKKS